MKQTPPYLYAPPEAFLNPDAVPLPEDEAAHAVRVLRLKAGNEVIMVDGEGSWYRVALQQVAKKKTIGVVIEHRKDVNEPKGPLCIGMPVLKSRQRFEAFLEKAVELGVTSIVPFISEHAEKRSLRMDRARSVMIAAMKQCRRSRLPALAAPSLLLQWLPNVATGLRCIATQRASLSLLQTLQSSAESATTILIGPEGGFSEAEIAAAMQAGFHAVSLGPRRLRSETAAIVAATTALMHSIGDVDPSPHR